MSSGDTFSVTYQFFAKQQTEAEKEAENIALEQTAELPSEAIPDKLRTYVGTVSDLAQQNDQRWQATIRYKKELAYGDSIQFLNVIFGNVSIKPGIRIIELDRDYLAEIMPGPGHGTVGIRTLLSIKKRPLSCTALKPVGSSPSDLARIAGQFAAGGIDIIKDDHGLANQPMADFESRVDYCMKAIRNGEQQSGKKSLYFPNITGSFQDIHKRLDFAKKSGADGVLVTPQLLGLSILSDLSNSESNLPIMAHPAFSGPYTIHNNSGFDPAIYFGVLWRALGADCIIYPNVGGRFSYSRQQCLNINKECRSSDLKMRTALPVPAGGITRDSLASWVRDYNSDTIFLMGGSLYQHPGGIKAATMEFHQTLSDYE